MFNLSDERLTSEGGDVFLRAQSSPWYSSIQFMVHSGDHVGRHLEMVQVKEGERVDPFLQLNHQEAQVLMDDLWQCGLRPSDGVGSVGQLQATEKHLKDMRNIVSGMCENVKIKIKLDE